MIFFPTLLISSAESEPKSKLNSPGIDPISSNNCFKRPKVTTCNSFTISLLKNCLKSFYWRAICNNLQQLTDWLLLRTMIEINLEWQSHSQAATLLSQRSSLWQKKWRWDSNSTNCRVIFLFFLLPSWPLDHGSSDMHLHYFATRWHG